MGMARKRKRNIQQIFSLFLQLNTTNILEAQKLSVLVASKFVPVFLILWMYRYQIRMIVVTRTYLLLLFAIEVENIIIIIIINDNHLL